ncbi:MAG: energy-coupling factor transporter transmembrane protein EcfT [Actinomycetia bacterium]|nr:energy-coupling factor transporter transmembrane protein EcfT [Actinomycetes bacterium]
MSAAEDLHPATVLVFFALVISLTVFILHPVVVSCSFVGALLFSALLRGLRATGKLLAGLLVLAAFAVALNVLFAAGTLRYGLVLAVMLAAALLWFSCYNVVVTPDTFLATVGRIVPSLALTISLALRFVPRYLRQLKRIAAAQRGLGKEAGRGLRARLEQGFATLAILTNWAFESALDTADSMRARGYGTGGRSAYAPWRFTRRDGLVLAIILACAALVVLSSATGALSVRFLPSFQMSAPIAATVAFALLCLLPALLELRKELVWRTLSSRI